MKKMINFQTRLKTIALAVFMTSSFTLFAGIPTYLPNPTPKLPKSAIDCKAGNSVADLDINAVRAKLLQSGDMWWDLNVAKYEVPKTVPYDEQNTKSPIYSGGLWFGGYDASNQLKVAAQTYAHKQGNVDFYPGPLDTVTVNITQANCNKWDKHFKINQSEVDEFIANKIILDNPNYVIPDIIKNWPANGGVNEAQFLAPFFDANANGIYEPDNAIPALRDYPKFQGDQAIWWVYNDKGNTHGQTGGTPIGIEVQALAFAFATSDELNTMTFYKYRVINRGGELHDTYFGQQVDPDLGFAGDDYVGCDVKLGIGYCYNGDEFDEGQHGYGINPPAVGIDFFQGPRGDDGNFIQMSAFVYYNNNSSNTGDPATAPEFYNYLRAKWKNGLEELTYGGDGNTTGSTNYTKFMFPGLSDPAHQEFSWTENTPGPGLSRNEPADRRFVQSAGPFTLKHGAVNEIIVGVVFAQADAGGSTASVNNLLIADRKAQALFDINFANPRGPIVPDLNIIELNKELILSIDNYQGVESYTEKVPGTGGITDTLVYKFQGYLLYQLVNGAVQAKDLGNPDQARLVAQCDIKDDIINIINQYQPADLAFPIDYFEQKVMVKGENKGIRHIYNIKTDLFATGSNDLVNNKKYYFMLIPYAHTKDANDKKFEQPYLQGQKRADVSKSLLYTAIPHIPIVENGGQFTTSFNNTPIIKRVDGLGNGGNELQFTDETQAEVTAKIASGDNSRIQPVYKNGKGPISIQVYNPKNVPVGDFVFKFKPNMAGWTLLNLTTGDSVVSERSSLGDIHEQIIPKWGFSISLKKIYNASEPEAVIEQNNAFITSTSEFSNPNDEWLGGIVNNIDPFYNESLMLTDDVTVDGNRAYYNVVNGTWMPFRLAASVSQAPGDKVPVTRKSVTSMKRFESIDIVLTPDESKWSRCIVLETGGSKDRTEGNAEKNTLRQASSVDKNGNIESGSTGFGWFPGYVVSVETGERLNVFFGEDSRYPESDANGRDMIWNPTSIRRRADENRTIINGGTHTIYVSDTRYDECKSIHDSLTNNTKKSFYNLITWFSVPLVFGESLNPKMVVRNEATIKLRVARAYEQGIISGLNAGWPMFTFNTANIATESNNLEIAKSALDLIKIVPNPYYAYSSYEISKVDTRIKFTNLPKSCVISIYTVNGGLVKRIRKDDASTTISEWDLRNDSGIPISSGMYIINVKAAGIGEKTLKWFAVMRKFDSDKF